MTPNAQTPAPGFKAFTASLDEMVKFSQGKKTKVKVEPLVINTKKAAKRSQSTARSMTNLQTPACRAEARRQSKAVAASVHAKEEQAFIDSVSVPLTEPVAQRHHQAMSPIVEASRIRITARVPNHMRGTLEQAADLMGSPVNQFIVQSAYQEAQRILERERTINLSRKGWLKVVDLMEHPPKPNRHMKEAAKIRKRMVRE